MRNGNLLKLVIAGLLCAVGVVIPMFSPIKIILEPASFTLGSHIAIFIAMFISPAVALAVALGTSLGFFLGGFPLVIVLRAITHVLFALIGALILQKYQYILQSAPKSAVFSFGIGLIHALSEVVVVALFYFGGSVPEAYYAKGFATSVVLLVGLGSLVHSMVDFGLSLTVWKALNRNNDFEMQKTFVKS